MSLQKVCRKAKLNIWNSFKHLLFEYSNFGKPKNVICNPKKTKWYQKQNKLKKGKKKLEIYFSDDTKPNPRRLVYLLDYNLSTITFYPESDEFFLSEVTIKGFKKLPPEFAPTGYIKGIALYYLNKN